MGIRSSAAAALAAALLVVCAVRSPREVEAGTAVRLSVGGLVEHAGEVFEGRVLSARARLDARGLIVTDYEVEVARSWWGQGGAHRAFTLPGGVLADGRGLVLPGMPQVAAGEEVLLFLSEPSGAGLSMPVGLAQGKFELSVGPRGERSLVRRAEGLQLLDEGSRSLLPAEALARFDYGAVVAEIEAACASKRARLEAERAGEGR